ncbi:unnamed protein product [Tetraodon nigroviridis]|nr:unnamed protein product [Tetraodon nigroviridis]
MHPPDATAVATEAGPDPGSPRRKRGRDEEEQEEHPAKRNRGPTAVLL